ncbi:A/G-specific adenine glycosylase [Candidatus Kaiserbacteria bacterium]|nr:A/G-specific adenine glycosylase [Candidatus Kaiserbacteria bacterium]
MTEREQAFVRTVWQYYKREGRHTLPWRRTKNPYRILVSELMLQQTQVDRVVPKYRSFIRQFPTIRTLAAASLGEVLRVWQGLGYNRRAKYLHACAQAMVHEWGGVLPKNQSALETLPGIGPYTAGAVMVFAHNTPVVMIETNIRTVFLHHFFTDAVGVPDSEITYYIERTLDREKPREWYAALMDYGTYLKKAYPNPSRKSKHHTIQSKFQNSDRQIRGAILRALTDTPQSRGALSTRLEFEDARIAAQLAQLVHEGMVTRTGGRYQLPD